MFWPAVPLVRSRLISTNGVEIVMRHRSTLSSNSVLRRLTKGLDIQTGNGMNTKHLTCGRHAFNHQLIWRSTFTSSVKLYTEKLSSAEVIGSKKATETIPPSTDDVSSTSTVVPIIDSSSRPFAPTPAPTGSHGGLASDLNMIRETFALRDVPREVLLFGLAGLIPYVATSSTSLFLAWDVKNLHNHGTGVVFDEAQAQALLDFLEPLQVGYGAIIISFLGAIHWGLQMAHFGGSAPYKRLGLGVAAACIAWPTVFMPFDYALIAQFAAFMGIYAADAQITSQGFAPKWYTTYRFVLTFVVGASIVATLVGRGKIGDRFTEVSDPSQRVLSLSQRQRQGLEAETGGAAYLDKLREEEEIIKANQKAKREKEQEERKQQEANGKEESGDGNKDGEEESESKEDNASKSEGSKEEDKGEEKLGNEGSDSGSKDNLTRDDQRATKNPQATKTSGSNQKTGNVKEDINDSDTPRKGGEEDEGTTLSNRSEE